MNLSLRLIALSGICALIGACATNHPSVAPAAATPAPPPTPATVPTPASAPASSDTTTSAPKVNRIYLEDKTLTNDEVKKLFEAGYKPTSHNGEVYYCRREALLGTRFEKTICRTADQMKQIEQESKDLAAAKQRPSGCATQGPGC